MNTYTENEHLKSGGVTFIVVADFITKLSH